MTKKHKAKEIWLTGHTVNKLPKELPLSCYLCKRSNHHGGSVIMEEGEFHQENLVFDHYYRLVNEVVYQYDLCHECAILLNLNHDEKYSGQLAAYIPTPAKKPLKIKTIQD